MATCLEDAIWRAVEYPYLSDWRVGGLASSWPLVSLSTVGGTRIRGHAAEQGPEHMSARGRIWYVTGRQGRAHGPEWIQLQQVLSVASAAAMLDHLCGGYCLEDGGVHETERVRMGVLHRAALWPPRT